MVSYSEGINSSKQCDPVLRVPGMKPPKANTGITKVLQMNFRLDTKEMYEQIKLK